METDHFEWNDVKEADVFRRQGFDFWLAARVFDDPNHVDRADRDRPEERTETIGLVDGRLLTVISADGHEGRIRISTAWASDREETDAYFAGE
jgi:uncharacterized DUF497 family protein